jgi:hypothetical protein
MTFQRLVVTTDAFAESGLERHRLLYAHGAQWVEAGPYRTAAACLNGSDATAVVRTTVQGAWKDLCGSEACSVEYTGRLCANGSSTTNILWESMQNTAVPTMQWNRTAVDSVSEWLGYCGVSPSGLELPTRLCDAGDHGKTNATIQPLLVTARVAGCDMQYKCPLFHENNQISPDC